MNALALRTLSLTVLEGSRLSFRIGSRLRDHVLLSLECAHASARLRHEASILAHVLDAKQICFTRVTA